MKRFGHHLAADPVTEDLDRDARSHCGVGGGQVRVGDRTLDRVAVAAARHPADEPITNPDRLGAERDRPRLVERQAAQDALGLRLGQKRGAPEERAFIELHREAESGGKRRLLRRDVRAPDPVPLLEPQRIDCLVSRRNEPMLLAGRPDRVPETCAKLRRAVQLPAELADVRDPDREARNCTDRELLRPHVAKGAARQVGRRQGLQQRTGVRPPDPETGERGRHVGDVHRAVARRVLTDPGEVVLAERGSGDDPEAILGESRHREVAFDPAFRVEHLRVRDGADLAGDPVGAQRLEE